MSAPTSPMTEEVVFPPTSTSQAAAPTDATTSGAYSQPADRINVPVELSILPPSTESCLVNFAHTVSSTQSAAADARCEPGRDGAGIGDSGGTIKPSSGGANEPDVDSASASAVVGASAPARTLEQRCDSLSEHLHNQNLGDESEAAMGQRADETSKSSSVETSDSAVLRKGGGASSIAGMFPYQIVGTSGVNRPQENDASCVNSGADFLPALNGGNRDQGSSMPAVVRVPSFLPLMVGIVHAGTFCHRCFMEVVVVFVYLTI